MRWWWPFAELFRQGLGKVVDRAMSSSDALIRLGLARWFGLHVQLRSLRPRFTAFGNAPAAGFRARRSRSQSCRPSRGRQSDQAADAGSADHATELATGDVGIGRAVDRACRILGKDIRWIRATRAWQELFAQAFHNSGARADKPFVALNCAAVPRP